MTGITALRPSTAMHPSTDRLLELVDRLAGQPVLLLVDAVADQFVHGTPKRISREAPVLILRWTENQVMPGGGANAVANIRALGGVPLVVGCVGDDEAGSALLRSLENHQISTQGLLVRRGWPTPTKTRILAGFPTGIKQQIVRYDREEIRPLEATEVAALRRRLSDFAGRASVAVLSDYGYGSVMPELVSDVRAALKSPSSMLVDSRFRLDSFRGVDGATPNEEEAEALLGGPLDQPPDPDRTGDQLRLRLETSFLLITRGSRGMALYQEGRAAHIPVHGSAQVADVTGAGDTVIGAFALAQAAGASPAEAALLANYAGGIVVMKMGTATLSPQELAEAIRSDSSPLERTRWVEF